MNTLLIGNILALVGSIMMVAIGLVKRREKILGAQCAQFCIYAAANAFLGGWSGCIANLVSLVRNFVTLRFSLTVPLKLVFIAAQAGITALVNVEGARGWIPVAAAAMYTWFLDTKSEIKLKSIIIITQSMWFYYDMIIHNYVSMAFDIMTFISTGIGIYMLVREKKKTKI